MATTIFNTRVDSYSCKDALQRVSEFLDSNQTHTIFTPNPEMLVIARANGYFRNVLNKGSLNICDGAGIQFVVKESIERIPGVDFMLDICALAEKKQKKVYLLGGDATVLQKTVAALKRQFPSLFIAGWHVGPRIFIEYFNNKTAIHYNVTENDPIIADIKRTQADIVFVGFGQIKQEQWIDEQLSYLPQVKVLMGVGGAFDYLSGRVTRAPRLLRSVGLEWVWRLIRQPWRIIRVLNATVVFLYHFYISSRKEGPTKY